MNKIDLVPPQVRAFIKWSQEDPEGFWEEAARRAGGHIYWFKKWDRVFSWEYPHFRWFEGGLTNISYNCLDYNVLNGRAGKAALIAESGETGETRVLTYAQLLDLVKKYAAALRGLGVGRGNRVAIYMPTGVEAVAAMLACARIGAIHVVIFAGFSGQAVADRLAISGAKFVLTQDEGSRRGRKIALKQIMDTALALGQNRVEKVVVLRKNREKEPPMLAGRDIFWEDFLALGDEGGDKVVPVEANEPLFLLPTSGTTAKPKVAVHNHGGYQVWVYCVGRWVYGLCEDDVWFTTADIGWIVGHSYCVYAPLLTGCTSVIYEGTFDYPRPDIWWEVAEKNRVTGIFTSPTAIRGLMRLGTEWPRQHDLSSVQRVFSAGEVLNPAAWRWLQGEVFGDRIPVIDNMWQTETSAAIFANPYGLGMIPIKPGSAGIPVPGIVAEVVDEKDGRPLAPGEKGAVVIKRPFPGLTPTLWMDPDGYRAAYWERIPSLRAYYLGDAASWDEDGYIWFAGRSDEVIKIAGHRIGTVEVENVLVSHPAVAEAGVSGVPDDVRGEVACAFVVLRPGYSPSEELKKELIEHVRQNMGPIVVIRDIQFVGSLPKTRSGKIMRRVMKALWLEKDLGDLSTIEEEASVDEVREAIEKIKGSVELVG